MTVETLKRHPQLPVLEGPLVLAILDGIGWGPKDGGDAVFLAQKPHLDWLWQQCPTRTLKAHGTAVGMPSDADMGNSEVGHNAMGAGRVFRQGAALVQDAIESGRLLAGKTWQWLLEPLLADPQATLHLCGLLSDGNVHSHIDHVIALVAAADRAGVQRIRVHALADGRDVADPSFELYIAKLQEALDRCCGRDYRIASGGGRMLVTMDRYEADWAIVERGWNAHVHGNGPRFSSVQAALHALRQEPGGNSDQNLGPFVVTGDDGEPIGRVQDGDSFVFWNFRGDRAIEITKAFEFDEFPHFDRGRRPQVRYAGMMQYDGDLLLPKHFLVEPPVIERTLGEFLAVLGLTSFAVSETQKYGHVTYFWNGNRSGVLDAAHEVYAEVPSDRIAFDQRPQMRAREITDRVLEAFRGGKAPDFTRMNYANGDMVGHTGVLAATIAAVETVDAEVGRLIALVRERRGVLVVTADHGNADDLWMRDGKGRPILRNGVPESKTSHTLNPVPLSIFDARGERPWQLRQDLPDAGLANLAATLLALLGYEKPADYAQAVIQPA